MGSVSERDATRRASEAAARPVAERGRNAESPLSVPLIGWTDVIRRVIDEMGADHLGIIAAGVAFFAMLAFVPGLIALISLYGLVLDADDVARHIEALSVLMPGAGRRLVHHQLGEIVESSKAGLSVGLAVSVFGGLFVASNGVLALLRGINIAYDEPETRGYAHMRLKAFLLTATVVGFIVLALPVITVLPAVLSEIGLPITQQLLVRLGRWPLLALLVVAGLSHLYRSGPNRTLPKWRWVLPGAVVATGIWIGMSFLFAWFVASFGRFNETYGALAGVILMLLWLYVSSLSILIGAEVNAELERQTAADTTIGPEKPMGQRGAHAADTLGPAQEWQLPRSLRPPPRNPEP